MSITHTKTDSDYQIKETIKAHKDFVFKGSPFSFLKNSRRIERLIEDCGEQCQLYTKGRVAAAVLVTLETAGLAGPAAIGAIVAHNASTINYNWEVARNPVTGNIDVNNLFTSAPICI